MRGPSCAARDPGSGRHTARSGGSLCDARWRGRSRLSHSQYQPVRVRRERQSADGYDNRRAGRQRQVQTRGATTMIIATARSPRPTDPDPLTNGDRDVRVLIADHDGCARRMIQTAVQGSEAVAMVTAADNTRDALELARYYRPIVLIVDTALPPRGGVELARNVLASLPETRIITVSAVPDDGTVLEALRAGAVGHVGKDIDPDQFPRIVLRAAAGEAIVPRRLIMHLLEVFRDVPEAGWRPLHSRLTTREWQVVELLGDDASTELIAERLNLSQTTVYTHVKTLMRKLRVHSRRDAVAAANLLRQEELLGREIPITMH